MLHQKVILQNFASFTKKPTVSESFFNKVAGQSSFFSEYPQATGSDFNNKTIPMRFFANYSAQYFAFYKYIAFWGMKLTL